MDRLRRLALLATLLSLTGLLLAPGARTPVRAAEYTLESEATYAVQPDAGTIDVSVDLSFTNTTPDPEGQFSVFDEVRLAIHDEATDVTATDADGGLDVSVEVENDVNVATVELRDDLRFEETTELTVSYTLPDTDDPQLRVRPSLVVFPAWSFGTSGSVTVSLPSGYEVGVDGDPLTKDGATLVSGPIDDPSAWLALVTAVRDPEYVEHQATVPLSGGTADLVVRSFADDEAWGERTLALVERALPLIEEEIGLPYPHSGQLVLTESVSSSAGGFAEGAGGGGEILVAFDQPPFTALHQVAHAWFSPALIESRWIREGMASEVAARVAGDLEVERPFDPAAEVEAAAEAAFPLDTWSTDAGPAGEAFGYAASWDVMRLLRDEVGEDALRTVLARVAASVGPYQSGEIQPDLPSEGVARPAVPLTSRGLLDQLETVAGADLAQLFADRVLIADDVALLDARAAARESFARLREAAESWGVPDPVRGALTAWSFEDAGDQIDAALAWLEDRDALLSDMEAAGLAAPDRLQQAYRSYGGGPEAIAELELERSVVEAYASTAEEMNAERSFIARIGLLGGPQPEQQLALANGRFESGDLRGALDAITEAQRILAAAETGGIVRLVSVVLLGVILIGVAVVLFRRRASYTAAP